MSFDKTLLEILACPQCEGKLEMTPEKDGLICPACKLKYPIRDDVPVMLADEAAPIK